ncbi:methyltransferase domain protein [Anaeromyces robustus]|uniref:Methyltransferase domain protein n=1 Tax=Anaeromyces robustus TaxID=1754192 RepID=A0A1Y1X6Y1_9FUNG|nr:methyltransferase domain protein [Anaeromyces robustus]|eukprot:ORX81074.1 methyltransferase domain protein [Anaeromyces robustus]
MIVDNRIDKGKAFDWGKTSEDYAKFRDIYPSEFYEKLVSRNIGVKDQYILDIATGTGVLPRNMYNYGAKWIGTDISENQIEQAKILAKNDNMNIEFSACSTEELDFPENTFDIITACQCFWYFDYKVVAPKLAKMLKKGGKFVVLCMEWLPFEDKIAGASEEVILKYSPNWSGAGEIKKPISVPEEFKEYFDIEYHEEYDLFVPFTRETWHGRIRACRGVGASLNDDELRKWNKEHWDLMLNIAPEGEFKIHHYAAILELKVKK